MSQILNRYLKDILSGALPISSWFHMSVEIQRPLNPVDEPSLNRS
jgi:hypothetical protein